MSLVKKGVLLKQAGPLFHLTCALVKMGNVDADLHRENAMRR